VSTCGALSAGHRAHIRDSRPLRGLTGEPIPAGSPPRVCGHVSALTYCTTMTACPSGLSWPCTRWSGRPTEDRDDRHRAGGLRREMGQQAPGLALRAGGRWPCGRRSEVVAEVLRARPRSCPESEGAGHSLIPHASDSSSLVKVRPSPESDRTRLRASRSPASRRRRLFSARSASSSARDTNTMSSACAVM
jgi:hypothetical protein